MITTEAIILAGGLGTRLQKVVPDRPKPMAEIGGKPFLEYLLGYLAAEGIKRIIFSVGFKYEVIRNHFQLNYHGIELVYSVEEIPLGTGGGLRKALSFCSQESVFVFNGDTYFPVRLAGMEDFFRAEKADLLMALHLSGNPGRYGTIELNNDGRILGFSEKNASGTSSLINGGIYLMNRSLLLKNDFPDKFSFEKDFLEIKTFRESFFGIVADAPFIDIGIPETYLEADHFFKDLKPVCCKALFLDRDGTINIEKNYVSTVDNFEFRDGIFELVNDFYTKGYLIFVITNQAGIARGYYSEEDFKALTEWMVRQFKEKGIKIEEVRYCPHHPDFSGECDCRKPKPGMILSLLEDYHLDPGKCVLIGDKMKDVEAGVNAGIGINYLIEETGKVTLENVAVYKG
jgi:D-glycero-alpha-D-manno-heptose 1-phosphate guanylyltransferase